MALSLNLGITLQVLNLTPLVAGLAALLLLLFYLLRRPHGRQMPSWAQWATLILRMATLVMLIAALSRPQVVRAIDVANLVFVMDSSASLSDQTRQAAAAFAEQIASKLEPNDRVGVVLFGAAPVVTQPLGPYQGELRLSVPGAAQAGLDQALAGGTDIASALRLARSLFPADGERRLVLMTDGNENIGRASAEIDALVATGVQVSVLPLQPLTGSPEMLIESIETPGAVREGETFETIVNVRSTDDAEASLRFRRDGVVVAEQPIKLLVGANRFALAQKAQGQGFHSFHVSLASSADTLTQNNEAFGYTVVKEKPTVLVLEGKPGQGINLSQALQQQGILVQVKPADSLPSDLAALEPYQSVVLVDAPASGWSAGQMQTLQAFVHDRGRGLVAIGGRNSYGPGGYTDTPLDQMLPVSSVPPSEQEKMGISLLLIIDKSGSMSLTLGGGTEKMAMAKEAAIRAVESLDPQKDEVGVLAFDISPTWVVPPQPLNAPGALDVIRRRISELEADGGTDIHEALKTGLPVLRLSALPVKHIVLLSDGSSQGESDYDDLLAQIRQDRVTLSTIAVGDDSDETLMQRLAKEANGRYYFTDKATDIPRLLLQDTQLANRPYLVEKLLNPQVTSASPVLLGLEEALPALNGYVVTTPKPAAQVVISSPFSDPLLAQWQYGLGRVVAWTSGADSAWAREWLGWDEFAQFWTQAVRWSLPSPSEGPLQVKATVEGNRVHLVAEAMNEDRSFRDLTDTVATVVTPDARSLPIVLRQIAPGLYEGQLQIDQPGAYIVQVRQYRDGPSIPPATGGFVVPPTPELSRLTANQQLLGELATDTGGMILEDPAEATARPQQPTGRQTIELWPWLLGAGLALFMFDIMVRRLWVLVEEIRWRGRQESKAA